MANQIIVVGNFIGSSCYSFKLHNLRNIVKQYNFHLHPFDSSHEDRIVITGNIIRQNDLLHLSYLVEGNLSKIAIPNLSTTPQRQRQLWENTCFEFFLGIKNTSQYWEFNLSLSGDWNIYRFSKYRSPIQEETAFNSLPYKLEKNARNLRLNLQLNLQPIIASSQDLQVGITTVIRSKNNGLSYWALIHPGEEADFHRQDSFILNL